VRAALAQSATHERPCATLLVHSMLKHPSTCPACPYSLAGLCPADAAAATEGNVGFVNNQNKVRAVAHAYPILCFCFVCVCVCVCVCLCVCVLLALARVPCQYCADAVHADRAQVGAVGYLPKLVQRFLPAR
jgi:hypothetical protein